MKICINFILILLIFGCRENIGTALNLTMFNANESELKFMKEKGSNNIYADSVLKIFTNAQILSDSLFILCGGVDQYKNMNSLKNEKTMKVMIFNFYVRNKNTFDWFRENNKNNVFNNIDYFFFQFFDDRDEVRILNYEKAKSRDIYLAWLQYCEKLSLNFWKLNCE